MSTLSITHGDATRPIGGGTRIIAHVCNDARAWGAGFVLAVSARWPEPEASYRLAGTLRLGSVQMVSVDVDLWVANMVAQHGIGRRRGVPPIRYDALAESLAALHQRAFAMSASVHMPRIGCGLAGGTWDVIAPLVYDKLVSRGTPVVVYDFPGSAG